MWCVHAYPVIRYLRPGIPHEEEILQVVEKSPGPLL